MPPFDDTQRQMQANVAVEGLGNAMRQDVGAVVYTVRELLDRQDKKLDQIIELLATKATIADLKNVELRIVALEKDKVERGAIKRVWWGIAAVLASSTGAELVRILAHK